MKLPKKIKVLSQDYEVVVMSTSDAATKEKFSSCDSVLSVISIDTQCSNQQQAGTLIHEILHAVFFLMAIKAKNIQGEEELVSSMSNGLAAVMRDNPKTFKAIMEALG